MTNTCDCSGLDLLPGVYISIVTTFNSRTSHGKSSRKFERKAFTSQAPFFRFYQVSSKRGSQSKSVKNPDTCYDLFCLKIQGPFYNQWPYKSLYIILSPLLFKQTLYNFFPISLFCRLNGAKEVVLYIAVSVCCPALTFLKSCRICAVSSQ